MKTRDLLNLGAAQRLLNAVITWRLYSLRLPLLRLFLIFTAATCCQISYAEQRNDPYTIAVIPSAPPVAIHTQWMPLVERLSRETGLEFRLKVYDQMAEFERDIWSGAPDFIFSSPIQVMVAHKSSGYLPLVRGGKNIAIGLFVRRDSPVKGIDDLAGKTISFVGNKNLCSVFVQHLLGKHKDKLAFTREYAGSTRNVIINVLLGKSEAGAVFIPELERETDETRRQLRPILTTPEIAPHPFSAHPRVPRTIQEAVKKASLAIAVTVEGAELFKTLRMAAPVAADYERDYRALEEIDVRGLTNWGQ
ncbi:MAG: phosphate/phosphite/phosphonate ABC transporter substrate-binding protein [Nitrospirae bacterium]|nr:phosphate/phosphite/phosphonate ABC transporter substrate-binding protein [Nitrospirota bacterium]